MYRARMSSVGCYCSLLGLMSGCDVDLVDVCLMLIVLLFRLQAARPTMFEKYIETCRGRRDTANLCGREGPQHQT